MVGVRKNAMESSRVRMRTGQTEELSLRVTTNAEHSHPHQKCLHHRQGKGGTGNQDCWQRRRHSLLGKDTGGANCDLANAGITWSLSFLSCRMGTRSPGLLSLSQNEHFDF